MKLDLYKVYSVILSNDNLKKFYNWYINHCISLTLPYHNISHTLGVMFHLINMYESLVNSDSGIELGDKDLYLLLTSGLFHDYNHSGGRFSDDINIQNAKLGLRNCLYTILGINEQSNEIITDCESLIDATQYPYIIPDEELSVQQRMIREADILVFLFDDYYTHNIFGLMEETKSEKNHKMFLAKQIQFLLESIKTFRIPYSIDLWDKYNREFMNLIELMTKIVEN